MRLNSLKCDKSLKGQYSGVVTTDKYIKLRLIEL
jgi:hypothetical protein